MFVGAVVALVAVAAASGGSNRGLSANGVRGGDHEARFDSREPDRPGQVNPAGVAYEDRAYPRGYIPAADVQRSAAAYQNLPKANASTANGSSAQWSSIGPSVGTAPGPVTESLRDSVTSGRITALAVDPNCGLAGAGCRLWVAAAGGGLWRTPDAMAPAPAWTPIDDGLPTNAYGSLIVDPTDPTGNTLYAGTGEANAINQAGLGLYKSTDGGDTWTLVPGSFAAAHDRSIGAIRVNPTNPDVIWMGTGLGRQGQSSVSGGDTEPPGAPPLGVWRSVDGGQTFVLQFSQPEQPYRFLGGVTDIEIDPLNTDRVYASLFGYGVWRTAADLEGGDPSWKQVFLPTETTNPTERTEMAITVKAGHTRIYLAEGWLDLTTYTGKGELFRTDDADQAASRLVVPRKNKSWIELSSPRNGYPGFASWRLCQDQCDYDLFLEVDPHDADVVWFGGSMVYEEIRPLQDQALQGLAPNRSNGRAVMRSQDSGVHFTDMTADTRQPHYEQMHPDQHALVFYPRNPDIAFVGSDGGLVRTDGQWDDASGTCASRDGVAASPVDLHECRQWLSKVPHRLVNLNAGLATLQFVQLSADPRQPQRELLGGTQDNGTFAYSVLPGTSTRQWFESVNGDGAASGFDASDPNVRVHTYFLGLADVNHDKANPLTWAFITQPLLESGEFVAFYTPLITDPVVSGTLYVGQQHVWRTKDNGGNARALEKHCASPGGVPKYDGAIVCGDFQPIGPDLTTVGGAGRAGQYVVAVERAPSDTHTMWAATRLGRIFVSTTADADPAKVRFNRIDSPSTPGRFVSGIAVDPADANHAWISYSGYNAATPTTPGHVFDVHYDPVAKSARFSDISGDLDDQPITDVAYDPVTGDLYASSDYGVVVLRSGSHSWEQAAPGLPLASVPGLTLVPSARLLYAPTYGRSVYRLTLPPSPIPAAP